MACDRVKSNIIVIIIIDAYIAFKQGKHNECYWYNYLSDCIYAK